MDNLKLIILINALLLLLVATIAGVIALFATEHYILGIICGAAGLDAFLYIAFNAIDRW
jgi:hypothetical protein